MDLKTKDLGFSYGPACIFENINLDITEPSLNCILGPNGAGKSTFMFCLNKLLKPTAGEVYIEGKELSGMSLKDISKIMSFVPHAEEATFSMSVMDTVLMGRQPHAGAMLTQKDLEIAAENIRLLGISDLSNRAFNELSAGQHQRVMIARGLTQEPKILLLDEPTANLDVKYQMLVMKMLRDIAHTKKIIVMVICHDLNVTSLYADRILLLANHGIYADGTSAEVLTEENVRNVYGVNCHITELQGRPHIALLDGDELTAIFSDIKEEDVEEVESGEIQET